MKDSLEEDICLLSKTRTLSKLNLCLPLDRLRKIKNLEGSIVLTMNKAFLQMGRKFLPVATSRENIFQK
jgi:hypothetical protein